MVISYWIDFKEEMSHRRLENSVHSITNEIFNAFQQIIECNERAFGLNMCISVQHTHTPDNDNFHKFGSLCGHQLPKYSILANDSYVTYTIAFQSYSCHTWQVTRSITPPSLKILHLSILQLWVMMCPTRYQWHYAYSHCACTVSRDVGTVGKFSTHIWNPAKRQQSHGKFV